MQTQFFHDKFNELLALELDCRIFPYAHGDHGEKDRFDAPDGAEAQYFAFTVENADLKSGDEGVVNEYVQNARVSMTNAKSGKILAVSSQMGLLANLASHGHCIPGHDHCISGIVYYAAS